MSKYKGQCLCGSIKYSVEKIETRMAHCHCTMCRKFHGADYSTLGEAKKENFRWVEGESLLKSYQATNGSVRQFCKNCGSSMTFAPSNDEGTVIEFALGTLDTKIDLRPDAHIYVDSKAEWVEIDDELPQFKAGRESNLCCNS